jgi:hypothetical protein
MSEETTAMQTEVPVLERTTKSISYKVEDRVSGDGKRQYKTIKSDNFTISLFPIKDNNGQNKGSRMLYNASVVMKTSLGDVTFSTIVKQLMIGKGAGNLIAGQESRMGRAVVSDWKPHLDANGKQIRDDRGKACGDTYEKTSIAQNTYNELISIISAVHNPPKAEEAE